MAFINQSMTIRILWVICIAFTLSGCLENDKARAQFENYQSRLASVLDTEPFLLSAPSYIELPRKRDLTLPVEDVRMGLLDAYELRTCGLFQLIADRNSILGKVQDGFRQLQYEITLLSTLEKCLNQIETESLKTQLESAYQQKREQFPTVYWNTISTSDAWRKQLTPSSSALILPGEPFPHSDALVALTGYANLSEHSTDIVTLQEPLEKQRYLGNVFYSMDESTRWLTATTRQLYRDDALIVCGANRDPTRLNYMRNVFDKFFVGEVQPYLSKINSLYLDAQPALLQLNEKLPEHPLLNEYRNAYFAGEHYQAFQNATKDHVQYWQRLFQRCNIKVGN